MKLSLKYDQLFMSETEEKSLKLWRELRDQDRPRSLESSILSNHLLEMALIASDTRRQSSIPRNPGLLIRAIGADAMRFVPKNSRFYTDVSICFGRGQLRGLGKAVSGGGLPTIMVELKSGIRMAFPLGASSG